MNGFEFNSLSGATRKQYELTASGQFPRPDKAKGTVKITLVGAGAGGGGGAFASGGGGG